MQVENSKMIYRGSDELARVYRGDHVIVWEPEDRDYSTEYLTFELVDANGGVLKFKPASAFTSETLPDLEFSKNNGPWIHYASATTEEKNVAYRDRVRLRCTTSGFAAYPSEYIISASKLNISTSYKMYGNIMSILYGDNFVGKTDLSNANTYCFYSLFGNSNCVNAEHLILPATTLQNGCYSNLLMSCPITKAPVLPATELASVCYRSMFEGTQLVSAPQLPATTLKTQCYDRMFRNCRSLVNAPELPATAMTSFCYDYMFDGCSSLASAPELPATSLARECYCNMFSDCTSLTTAPELPAESLDDHCYFCMFSGCTNLNYVKCLATSFFTYSTAYWLNGVSQTGTFVKNPNADWDNLSYNNDGIPENWTVIDAT